MKNFILSLILISIGGILVFLASCGSDDEFEDENTFNLDTLYVLPSTIGSSFTVFYEVTTTGFPQFFIDVYLSEDDEIDAGDLLIAEGAADTDTSTPDKAYLNGLSFILVEPPGGSGFMFQYSYDQENWEGDAVTQEALSGKSRYIIGRFYHLSGLQIDVFRSRMAKEVTFQ